VSQLAHIAEAISMANRLTSAAMRGDVNEQYHWANELVADALSRGAKGPEVDAEDDMERARR